MPDSTMTRLDSSSSIMTMVTVAARLITRLRHRPSRPAGWRTSRGGPSGVVPVIATDLVAHDATGLEGHDPLAQRGHDLGVVGGHEHGRAHLVDAQQQLDDLPADERVEVAGRLVGDDQLRVRGPSPGRWRRAASRHPTAGPAAGPPGRSGPTRPSSRSTVARICLRGAPVTSSANATFSRTVLRGSSRKSWNTMPIWRRSCGISPRLMVPRSWPATSSVPVVASSSHTSSLMSVLLPAPEGPTRNTKSPSGHDQVDVLHGVLAVGVDLGHLVHADRDAAGGAWGPGGYAVPGRRIRRPSMGSLGRPGGSSTAVRSGWAPSSMSGVRVAPADAASLIARSLAQGPPDSGWTARGRRDDGSPADAGSAVQPLQDLLVQQPIARERLASRASHAGRRSRSPGRRLPPPPPTAPRCPRRAAPARSSARPRRRRPGCSPRSHRRRARARRPAAATRSPAPTLESSMSVVAPIDQLGVARSATLRRPAAGGRGCRP